MSSETIKIPDFLFEMSVQLNAQDNRITAHPIFNVQYDQWLTCADGRGDKEVVLIISGGECTEYEIHDLEGFCEYFQEIHPVYLGELVKDTHEELSVLIGDLNNIEWVSFDWPEDVEVEKISMQKVKKVVKSCLTEADAKAFIERKQHDYPKLEIYVESMVFCPQMIQLREWIMSLSGKEKSNPMTTTKNIDGGVA